MDIDKDKIKKSAIARLNEGKTKQEVYEELYLEYKNRKIVADIVRYIPNKDKLEKYKIYNTAFLVFLITITLISLVKISLGIIWLIWLIYIVATKNFKLYYWNSILGGTTLLIVPTMLLIGYSVGDYISTMGLTIAILISAIFIAFGILIPKLVTPPFKEIREFYTNSNGSRRIVVKHIFDE